MVQIKMVDPIEICILLMPCVNFLNDMNKNLILQTDFGVDPHTKFHRN
jgi:hypothetical protein